MINNRQQNMNKMINKIIQLLIKGNQTQNYIQLVQSQQTNKTKIMINTKGFYYFDHINPQHNVRSRKLSRLDLKVLTQHINQQNQFSNTGKPDNKEIITGIIGQSFSKKVDGVVNTTFVRNRKREGRLTFQKLQQLLNDKNSLSSMSKQQPKKPKIDATINTIQSREFYRKNSSVQSPNHRANMLVKTPKNKQLKQFLFKRSSQQKRSNTAMSKTFCKSNVIQHKSITQHSYYSQHSAARVSEEINRTDKPDLNFREDAVVYPTLSGVFIPSSKFKCSKPKTKQKRRYKTAYNL